LDANEIEYIYKETHLKMAKIPIKHLVSLIIEQINYKAELDKQFPPDKNVYIDDYNKYPILFEPVEKNNSSDIGQNNIPQGNVNPERGKIRTLEPEVEPELAMVAEQDIAPNRGSVFQREELPEAIRIPVDQLTVGKKSEPPKRIVCEDPDTGEMVEGVVISKVVARLPSDKWMLIFRNHGEDENLDRPTVKTRYVILADNMMSGEYMKNLPRRLSTGNPPDRDVLENLLDNPPAEDASDEEKEAWKERVETLQNARAKRYALFPLINKMFSEHGLLDKLDISLIPETWATSIRTEHTTNVSKIRKFGGTTAEIDADFFAVRDLDNVEEAIDEVMDLRADLAMGAIDDDGEGGKRDRDVSTAVPRRHANYIYQGGNWYAKQRVHDENFFQREGGKTPVYNLLSKNIQEGNKGVTIESKLEVKGEVVGNEYIIKSIFTSELNVRHPETGQGVKIGELFQPVVTGLRKPLGDINSDDFTLEKNIEFFVNEGRTKSGYKTGFLPDFFTRTGENIKNSIDPDAVLEQMVELVQLASQYNPEDENA